MPFSNLKKTVARVDVEDKPSGTAFLVARDRIVTALHVLAGRTQVNVVFVDWPNGERERVATLDWRHPAGHDLAILTLDRPCPADVHPIGWSPEPLSGNARWSTFGFPSEAHNGHALVDEAVKDPSQRIHEWGLAVLQLHTSTAAYSLGGFSGAPCTVADEIVGIVTHQLRRFSADAVATDESTPALHTLYALPVALLVDAGIPHAQSTPGMRSDHYTDTYVDILHKGLSSSTKHLIDRAVSLDGSTVTLSPVAERSTVDLLSSRVHYISGPSGRGKTSALQMIAKCALECTPRLISVFLDTAEGVQTIVTRIATSLRNVALSDLDESEVAKWLASGAAVIFVDDWQNLPARLSKQIETGIMSMPATTWVIAGTNSCSPLLNLTRYLPLSPYSDSERARALALGAPKYPKLLHDFDRSFQDLAREPVFLAQIIRFREISPSRKDLPWNLPVLMQSLFDALLFPRGLERRTRLDVALEVCRRMAGERGGFRAARVGALPEVQDQAQAAEIAMNLVDAGIWTKKPGALLDFQHEVWRTFFRAVTLADPGDSWSTPETIAAWVHHTDIEFLQQMLPFAAGLITDLDLQNSLFDTLLKRDISLYLQCLGTRASAQVLALEREWARQCLDQIHRGYFGLVEALAPSMKPRLEPWKFLRGEVPGTKPIIAGDMRDNLEYYLGFADAGGPDAILDPKAMWADTLPYAAKGGAAIHGAYPLNSGRDSGRLIAAHKVLSDVDALLERHLLPPVGWLARERLCILADNLSDLHGWREDVVRTVEDLRRWAEENQGDAKVTFIGSSSTLNDGVELDEVIALARQLISEGLGEAKLDDLLMPGFEPDVSLFDPKGVDKIVKRSVHVFTEAARAYRVLCEQHFPCAAQCFAFAQFPCSPTISIFVKNGRVIEHEVFWNIHSSWEVSPIVHVGRHDKMDVTRLDAVVRYCCARDERPYVDSVWEQGKGDFLFNSTLDPITGVVCRLLRGDIRRLRAKLPLGR